MPEFSPIASKPGSAGRDDFSNIMAPPARINRLVYGMLPGRSQKVSRRVLQEKKAQLGLSLGLRSAPRAREAAT